MLFQRGVKKKLQGFEWSRKIYGVRCTCRVQTTLMTDDQLPEGEGTFFFLSQRERMKVRVFMDNAEAR